MSAIGTKLTATLHTTDRLAPVAQREWSFDLLLWVLILGIPLIIFAEIQWVAAMVAQ